MKKIITLHPVYNLERWYFNRDVWQIWYIFRKKRWYDAEVWCLKNKWQENFEIKWQQWRWFENIFKLYFTLFKESKNIDLLHMYHIWRFSLIWAIIYKLRNQKWKIYIKMDTPLIIENIDNRHQLKKIPKFIMILFLKLIDYIWFEDKKLQKFMKDLYPKYRDKFILTTSWAVNIPKFIWNIEKENIISLCGRFWSEQKNNELLLDVLERYNISFIVWYKIQLIWSLTDDFLKKIDDLLIKKPMLKEIIVQVWFLDKKEELYHFLSRTKIFLHTANYEWDPNVQYDSMFCGCYMISTDVANIKQNYPKKYSIFYDIKYEVWLYNSLKQWIEINNTLQAQDYINIQNYCLENFTREESLQELTNRLWI